jgi:multicomponent Na+:H+ antiporter subunit E
VTRFINILLLTAVWAALFVTLDLRALAVGALVAWAVLALSRRFARDPVGDEVEVMPRPVGGLLLLLAFFRELVLSAFSVAKEAWRPQLALEPGMVAVPIELASDLEITVLASLISLTPGTLSIEVSPDRKTLYVHALITDAQGDEVRASIRDRLERPVRRAFMVRRRSSEARR